MTEQKRCEHCFDRHDADELAIIRLVGKPIKELCGLCENDYIRENALSPHPLNREPELIPPAPDFKKGMIYGKI